jgi:hypothetical protein
MKKLYIALALCLSSIVSGNFAMEKETETKSEDLNNLTFTEIARREGEKKKLEDPNLLIALANMKDCHQYLIQTGAIKFMWQKINTYYALNKINIRLREFARHNSINIPDQPLEYKDVRECTGSFVDEFEKQVIGLLNYIKKEAGNERAKKLEESLENIEDAQSIVQKANELAQVTDNLKKSDQKSIKPRHPIVLGIGITIVLIGSFMLARYLWKLKPGYDHQIQVTMSR